MMDITIEKLHETDAEKLYEFELENRDFFEEMVPSRGDEYYNFENFKKRHQALLDEQAKGLSYFFLIKDKDDLILGRINIIDIDKSQKLGHVGYRVGKAYTRKGVASKALKLLIDTMNNQGIKQILAKTTINNIASQKVLKKAGFKQLAINDEEFTKGQRVKFISYSSTVPMTYVNQS
jgi:[ribosomal protein S5]-alanine N-acetyltransferase